MNSPARDRYVTFADLDCDANATAVIEIIHQHLADPAGAGQWGEYFSAKLIEQQRLGVNDLFFVGSQMNNLLDFLEERRDEAGAELLYQVEQECC